MFEVAVRTLPQSADICQLKTADVLLVHTKRNLWGWLIRLGTRCYWNHALMVCAVEEPQQGYGSTLVIDPKTSGGVEVDCAAQYLSRLDKYDVAIKRLEADWFQNDSQVDKPCLRSRICNIALNEVDIKLGSRLAEFIDKIIRQVAVISRFVRRKIRGPKPPSSRLHIDRPAQLKAFTCGGFVQWCYYQAVFHSLDENDDDEIRLKDVLFNPRVKRKASPFDLLTTTPADLANCGKLSWKYVIKDGVVQQVSSEVEVKSIIGPA
jgi:hypothetical protein